MSTPTVRLTELATVALALWRDEYVETANGYILCEWHAQAWRDGGNDVSMAPITDEYAAECGGCADCDDGLDDSPRVPPVPYDLCRECGHPLDESGHAVCQPYADLTVNVFISHPQTLKTIATLQVARDENGLAVCDALQEAGWRVTHD